MLHQLELLLQQNAEMATQLLQLREENAALRRQFPSVSMVHQPYAPLPHASLVGSSPRSTRPRSPPRESLAADDVEMSPSRIPDPKRTRLQHDIENSGTGALPVPSLGSPRGHGL